MEPAQRRDIIRAWGVLLEELPSSSAFIPESTLPFPKETIRAALTEEIEGVQDQAWKDRLGSALSFLDSVLPDAAAAELHDATGAASRLVELEDIVRRFGFSAGEVSEKATALWEAEQRARTRKPCRTRASTRDIISSGWVWYLVPGILFVAVFLYAAYIETNRGVLGLLRLMLRSVSGGPE